MIINRATKRAVIRMLRVEKSSRQPDFGFVIGVSTSDSGAS